jgi:hypothetical protein
MSLGTLRNQQCPHGLKYKKCCWDLKMSRTFVGKPDIT